MRNYLRCAGMRVLLAEEEDIARGLAQQHAAFRDADELPTGIAGSRDTPETFSTARTLDRTVAHGRECTAARSSCLDRGENFRAGGGDAYQTTSLGIAGVQGLCGSPMRLVKRYSC